MNPIGAVAAVSAFIAIWLGHVAVRKIEFASPTLWIPAGLFVALGLIVEWGSLASPSRPVSTALGILGITFAWDALELTRQQRRVRKGHAPANPNNPRHAALLAEAGSRATTMNLMKRDPMSEAAIRQSRAAHG